VNDEDEDAESSCVLSSALRENVCERNKELLASLKNAECGDELLQLTKDDVAKARMSDFKLITQSDDVDYLLSPRFAVTQEKADGSKKIRPVDHFSWSSGNRRPRRETKNRSVNGAYVCSGTVKHDTIDTLEGCMRCFFHLIGECLGLLRVDIDSAFRRVPLMRT